MTDEQKTTIHHFLPQTGEYMGQSIARLDPVGKKPLVPAHSTIVAPPDDELGVNEIIIFNGAEWVIVMDYRGHVFYDGNGQEVTITEIDKTPDDSWSVDKPAPTHDELTAYLSSYRYDIENGGVLMGDGVQYWTTRDSRSAWNRIHASALADADFVLPVYKAMNGFFEEISAARIIAADEAGIALINGCIKAELTVISNIGDYADADAVEAAFDDALSALSEEG